MEWKEWYAHLNEGRADGPLPADAMVTVMHLDGERDTAPAGEMNWGVLDVPGEIVAYRQIGWVVNMKVSHSIIRSGPPLEQIIEQALRKMGVK